jgi:hypothetical protein
MYETKVEFVRIRDRTAGEIVRLLPVFCFFLLTSLPSFAQKKPEPVSGEVQESMLVWKMPFSKKPFTVSGKDIFVVNLPLKRFLASYRSEDEAERGAAHAFLLGVLDATEGTVWCSYRQYKSTTILEEIYLGLKDMDALRGDERAAHAITGLLKTSWPCKKER